MDAWQFLEASELALAVCQSFNDDSLLFHEKGAVWGDHTWHHNGK
jgi:hypothetical protein